MTSSAKTSMVMISSTVDVGPIWKALWRERATALPVFHALTGADNVGQFSRVVETNNYIKVYSNINNQSAD